MQSVNELLRDAKETCSSAKMSFLGVVTCWLIVDQSQYSIINIITKQYIFWPDTANGLNLASTHMDAV